MSIYKSIKKLPAAHYLIFKGEQLSIHPYWRAGHNPKYEWTEEEALDRLDVELKRSVESMLISDVPLGAFISGGDRFRPNRRRHDRLSAKAGGDL